MAICDTFSLKMWRPDSNLVSIFNNHMQTYSAIPFSRFDPFLLPIDGGAAQELFGQYLKED